MTVLAKCISIILTSLHRNIPYILYKIERFSANPWPKWTGVMHGYEIEYVFGVPIYNTTAGYINRDQALSRKMIQYWSSFATNGQVLWKAASPFWNNGTFGSGDFWPKFDFLIKIRFLSKFLFFTKIRFFSLETQFGALAEEIAVSKLTISRR
jgi:hypothetical protein